MVSALCAPEATTTGGRSKSCDRVSEKYSETHHYCCSDRVADERGDTKSNRSTQRKVDPWYSINHEPREVLKYRCYVRTDNFHVACTHSFQ